MSTRILFLCCLWLNQIAAQTNTLPRLEFKALFGSNNLQLDTFYKFHENDSIKFETLRFYISGITIKQNSVTVGSDSNQAHLLDLSNPHSMQFALPASNKNAHTIKAYNQLELFLGIDSLTNVSGALEGDLDPTKGMYWTWQSGYINLKLEGVSNLCNTRQHEFQFHLGGYLAPFNALQHVVLEIPSNDTVEINLDIKACIEEINLVKQNLVMTPGEAAVRIAAIIAKNFKCQL